PMIPGLNDAELERILEAAAGAGARSAGAILLRLPHELGALFTDWLQRCVPDRAAHVLSLIRQTRGGSLNDSNFGSRFRGSGPYAGLLAARFRRAARQYGLDTAQPPLDCTAFARPVRTSEPDAQLSLF
ncbi:MAG TPA: radical SAM protein, partial [Acidiphilium sp.]